MDYRFNDKFLKLYLNTPENKLINKLLKDTLTEILEKYNALPPHELKWLEDYLNCIIEVKKILDIPKQLNLFIYQDKLPAIKARFMGLASTAPPAYAENLLQFQAVLDQELNLIITQDIALPESYTAKDVVRGFHLSKYKRG